MTQRSHRSYSDRDIGRVVSVAGEHTRPARARIAKLDPSRPHLVKVIYAHSRTAAWIRVDRVLTAPAPEWLTPLELDVLELLRSKDDWWRVIELHNVLIAREPYCAVPPSSERLEKALDLLTRQGFAARSGAPFPPAAWLAVMESR